MAEGEITRLLKEVESGDEGARDRLLERIYKELRKMAGGQMRSERADHTLQPTALVNEAWMRLAPGKQAWENRAHFFGAAAQAMQRVLIEHARKRVAVKRGGGNQPVTFRDLNVQVEAPDLDLLALDQVLENLEAHDQRLALVVRLRYFVGLSVEETAKVTGTSPATVKRDWTYARAWILDRLGD